jgi:CO/xanthine dehydrogenase FAD-binding subunit
MSLHPQFAAPRSLAAATDLLGGLSTGAVVIAGGQELMPHVNYGRLMPAVYVDIGGLSELRGIAEKDGRVAIGALTVHRELQRDPLVTATLPLLAHAAAQVGGGRQVHNRGTIGGNIVAMHPLYDILPPLLALGAEAEVAVADGQRTVPLAALIKETAHGLGSTSILVRVRVAPMAAGDGWSYQKLKMTDGCYGSANAAAIVRREGNRIVALSVVIGAVTERPIDATSVLAGLLGRAWSDNLGAEVEASCVALVAEPLSDQQGAGAWRKAMAGVVARRAIAEAYARAGR